MILEKLKHLDIQKVGDLNEGITAGISEESMPFVFELVSKQLYSNPIGSVIREITSNCFDSHVEAGIDEPVIISQEYHTEEGYSISFKDVGVGLSPERVEKIFMNYFSSTKRNDNSQIGGFGIGSKTPLAYADMFYITTIYEGLKYEYILHKGESKPTLESLLGYNEEVYTGTVYNENLGVDEEIELYKKEAIGEPTEEHNGTIIKINIENNDRAKFTEELKFQLAYFDNVYFTGWPIPNNYDIYEGDYFKFRSDIKQAAYSYDVHTNIHLCIGKVRYPIDFSKVNISDDYKKLPVAVKFEIGELQVTPSRETLRYNAEGIKLIQERVQLAVDEVLELFKSQNPEIEDLQTYVSVMNDKPKITFDADKRHYMYLWEGSKIENKYKFKPLVELPIKKTPKNLFFMWECVAHINSNGIRNSKIIHVETVDNSFILNRKYIIIKKGESYSSYTDLYISKEHYYNGVYIIKRKEIDYEDITKLLGIDKSKDIRKAKTIKDYLNIINKIVLDRGELYSNLRATDEWITEYKKSIKESSAAYQRKINKKIFARTANNRFSSTELKVYELHKRTGILVYGFKEDQSMLSNIWSTVTNNKSSFFKIDRLSTYDKKGRYTDKANKKLKAFMVIQIAKGVEKDLLAGKNKKIIYWDKLFDTKFFRKIETSYYISQQLISLQLSSMEYRKKFCLDFMEDYNAVKESITDFRSDFSINEKYLSGNLIPEMLNPLYKFIEKHIKTKLYLNSALNIQYLVDEDLQEVVDYLKYKKFKLRKHFYLKSKEQLKYEEGVRQILRSFKYPITNLLTYTLNQTNNVNNQEDECTSSTEEI